MNQHEPDFDAQPDAHFHHAYKNLPEWLLKASPLTRTALKTARPDFLQEAPRGQHQALKTASEAHWNERNRLEARLGRLQNARDFAQAKLSEALNTRFGLVLDVNATYLRLYIPENIPWFSVKSGGARTWTVSLLDAALHNFEESETKTDAYEPASAFITRPSPTGQFDTLPAVQSRLSIPDFTHLCRELDIGGQYQAYLQEFFGANEPLARAALELNVVSTHKAALRATLELARLREDIPADAYQAIIEVMEGREGVRLNGQRLLCHDLKIMASALTGIVVFAPDLEHSPQATSIVAYIPDDPEHPLKQYPDGRAFIQELTRKLRSPAYQAFFSRFVDHGERGHFFAGLSRRLSAVTWHERPHGDPLPNWRDTPIEKPHLQFSVNPIHTDLWTCLYQQQLNKILNDARTLAVSTASADSKARWARWDAISNVATAILEVASFVALPFVPFLGELMLAYMAYQVLDETFEGILDWAEGLKAEAFAQLMNLTELVVQLGTFAIGGALAVEAFSRLMPHEAKALFAPLKPVEKIAGKTRYWKPDLSPYEQPADLPIAARPDRLGLYQHEGKTLLRLEDRLYAVNSKGETDPFQIEHPKRADAYRPPLRHNDHGAWQTELDRPLTWDRDTVMRRLGPDVEPFSSGEREQILRISGFHDNVLRETHVELQRPPSLLTDTIKRYRIDRDIEALINQPGSDHPDRYQALNQRLSLFESRYRELEKTDDRQVQLLQGEVRGLPTDIAQELVDNASGTELMQLHDGRVPQRLKDVAVKALEAVRVARAYEGFYLNEAMETLDTHRLALHSLESLPGWPPGLRIEVREYSATGPLRDSIGPDDAPKLQALVYRDDGTYQVQGSSAPPNDFFDALLQALPETDRMALGLSAEDAQAFKQRLAEQSATQPQLRTLFAKHPHRKPFYDPTTMRLPGGTDGYLRNQHPTPPLDHRVREIFPSLAPDEVQSIIADLQRHPDGARMELSRLTRELHQLDQDLRSWSTDVPTAHPVTGLPFSDLEQQAAGRNRRWQAQEIQRSWRRQSDRDLQAPEGSGRYMLRLSEPILGDLPPLTADFSHVSVLALNGNRAGQGVPAFLQRFSGLRQLELRRFAMQTIPDAIGAMENLETLILNDCAINVDVLVWEKLSSLKKLTMLDLHRNQLQTVPSLTSMPTIVHLDLSQTGLVDIPGNALQHPRLEALLLMDNNISQLPAGLFESQLFERRVLHLSRNPLSDRAMELIKQYYLETSYDLGVSAPDADVQRVIALYPTLEPEQASEFVYELPGTLADGRAEITRLEAELIQLSSDLSAWTANLPPVHPLTGEPFNAHQLFVEHANRDGFKEALEGCWRHESALDDFNDALEPTFELIINQPINGELPVLSADFSHVSSLEVRSIDGATRVGEFLDAFPNLTSLRLRECTLGDIPAGVFKMGRLRSLSLAHCRISLSAESTSALAGMELLDYLDLSANPLGLTPDLSQMPNLATVLLNDTGITEIPPGLFQLNDLDWADLSSNAITGVPSDLMELPTETAETLSLRGNPFSEEALTQLVDHFRKTQADFGIQEVIDRAEMEISTSENSEIDE